MKEVTAQDEWCAEAYLKTNYGVVTRDALKAMAKRYILTNVTLLQYSGNGNDDEED